LFVNKKGWISMDRFELSFKNPIVRMWMYCMIPALLISTLSFLILPSEWHAIPTFLPLAAYIGYSIYKRKIKSVTQD
jgi:hypothetical protein